MLAALAVAVVLSGCRDGDGSGSAPNSAGRHPGSAIDGLERLRWFGLPARAWHWEVTMGGCKPPSGPIRENRTELGITLDIP
jgi:hypothetical protein